MKKPVFLLLSVTLLTACGSQNNVDIEQLEKEVFAVHDEVMPKMGQIMDLQKAVSSEVATLDSLLKIKTNDSLQKRKQAALELSTALKTADEDMMNWMHAYNGDSLKALGGDAAQKALQLEKEKINKVKTQMLESIAKSEAFLKK